MEWVCPPPLFMYDRLQGAAPWYRLHRRTEWGNRPIASSDVLQLDNLVPREIVGRTAVDYLF